MSHRRGTPSWGVENRLLHHVVEPLEARRLLTVLLDPYTQPKFVNPLPQPSLMQPAAPGGTHYEVRVGQTQQALGLVDPMTGAPLMTTVWGYGANGGPVSYPGPSFVAQKDQAITVRWINGLVDAQGNPLQHLLPVDSSLHWADPLGTGHGGHGTPYTGPVPIVSHLHGGHTRSDSDGLPDAWFTPDGPDLDTSPDYVGRLYNEVYTYDNDQEAATLWYHDHALGITRLNVYAGLAGYYLLRDAWDTGIPDNPATPQNENPSNLPAGRYELGMAIQDRLFTHDGQLFYPSDPEMGGDHAMRAPTSGGGELPPAPSNSEVPNPSVLPEFFGDHILVNGQAWPFLEVEPRKYRFRVLNGSDSRFYNLWVNAGAALTTNPGGNGPQIIQVGSDTGLLDRPVALSQLLIAPGERADVVIDFSQFAGQNLVLRNNARGPFPKGSTVDPRTTGQIMMFRVGNAVTEPDLPIRATLRATPIEPLVPNAPARKLMLFEGTDAYGRLQPMLGIVDPNDPSNGTLLWDDAVTEDPTLNGVEVWEIHNATPDAHPMHLHLASFQVLGRQKFGATTITKEMDEGSTGGVLANVRYRGQQRPPELNERGWKDTVIMYPGEVTRIVAKFDRPGEYVWHCHILSHEDHEMMRPFVVRAPEPPPAAPVAAQVFSAARVDQSERLTVEETAAEPLYLLI